MNNISLINNSLIQLNAFKNLRTNSLPSIGVFWDIENCSPPPGKLQALLFIVAVRNRFFKGHRESEFLVVCDVHNQKKSRIDEINNAMVTIAHVSSDSKNASDDKLKQAIRKFADTYNPPSTIILISGDINFSSELADLRYRNNFYVILIHNKCANASFVSFANESYLFDAFFSKDSSPQQAFFPLPDTKQLQLLPEDVLKAYLRVENLPLEWNKHLSMSFESLLRLVKARMVSLKSGEAVLLVPDAHHAYRAHARFDNILFHGKRLRVSLLDSRLHEALLCSEVFLLHKLKEDFSMHSSKHSSMHPSMHSSMHPSKHPSMQPSMHPSMHHSMHPSMHPSMHSSHRLTLSEAAPVSFEAAAAEVNKEEEKVEGQETSKNASNLADAGPALMTPSCFPSPEALEADCTLHGGNKANSVVHVVESGEGGAAVFLSGNASSGKAGGGVREVTLCHRKTEMEMLEQEERRRMLLRKLRRRKEVLKKGSVLESLHPSRTSTKELLFLSGVRQDSRLCHDASPATNTTSQTTTTTTTATNKATDDTELTKCMRSLIKRYKLTRKSDKMEAYRNLQRNKPPGAGKPQESPLVYQHSVLQHLHSFQQRMHASLQQANKPHASFAFNETSEHNNNSHKTANHNDNTFAAPTSTPTRTRDRSLLFDMVFQNRQTQCRRSSKSSPPVLLTPSKRSAIQRVFDKTEKNLFSDSISKQLPSQPHLLFTTRPHQDNNTTSNVENDFYNPLKFIETPATSNNTTGTLPCKQALRNTIALMNLPPQNDPALSSAPSNNVSRINNKHRIKPESYNSSQQQQQQQQRKRASNNYNSGANNNEELIELEVSNLDYNISLREWQEILRLEFKALKVVDISMHMRANNTSVAKVLVAAEEDVRSILERHNHKKIGYKRIQIVRVGSTQETFARSASLCARPEEAAADARALEPCIRMTPSMEHFVGGFSGSGGGGSAAGGGSGGGSAAGGSGVVASSQNDHSSTSSPPDTTKMNVVDLLTSIPCNELPLFQFFELYQKRYKSSLTMLDVQNLRPTLEVQSQGRLSKVIRLVVSKHDTTTCNTITASGRFSGAGGSAEARLPENSTMHQREEAAWMRAGEHADRNILFMQSVACPLKCMQYCMKRQMCGVVDVSDGGPRVKISLKSLSAQMHKLLQAHHGNLFFECLPYCYSIEFGSLTSKVDLFSGVSLEHLITCVPGIQVSVTSSGCKIIHWSSGVCAEETSCQLTPQRRVLLAQLSELVSERPRCCMPLSKVHFHFQGNFAFPLNPLDYDCNDLPHLLNSFPHCIQVLGMGEASVVTLTHAAQVSRLSSILEGLFKTYGLSHLCIDELPDVYMHLTGSPFKIWDFGVAFIDDILPQLPSHTFSVFRQADKQYLLLQAVDAVRAPELGDAGSKRRYEAGQGDATSSSKKHTTTNEHCSSTEVDKDRLCNVLLVLMELGQDGCMPLQRLKHLLQRHFQQQTSIQWLLTAHKYLCIKQEHASSDRRVCLSGAMQFAMHVRALLLSLQPACLSFLCLETLFTQHYKLTRFPLPSDYGHSSMASLLAGAQEVLLLDTLENWKLSLHERFARRLEEGSLESVEGLANEQQTVCNLQQQGKRAFTLQYRDRLEVSNESTPHSQSPSLSAQQVSPKPSQSRDSDLSGLQVCLESMHLTPLNESFSLQSSTARSRKTPASSRKKSRIAAKFN